MKSCYITTHVFCLQKCCVVVYRIITLQCPLRVLGNVSYMCHITFLKSRMVWFPKYIWLQRFHTRDCESVEYPVMLPAQYLRSISFVSGISLRTPRDLFVCRTALMCYLSHNHDLGQKYLFGYSTWTSSNRNPLKEGRWRQHRWERNPLPRNAREIPSWSEEQSEQPTVFQHI